MDATGWELVASWSYGWYEKSYTQGHDIRDELRDFLRGHRLISRQLLCDIGGDYFNYAIHPQAEC